MSSLARQFRTLLEIVVEVFVRKHVGVVEDNLLVVEDYWLEVQDN